MNGSIRILLVEDSTIDAELVARVFRRHGNFEFARVDTSSTLRAAIKNQMWDIIISDYRMPGFSGMTALAIVRCRDKDVPFILLSGLMEEATMRLAIVAGASLCLLKGAHEQLVSGTLSELKKRELAIA